MHPRPTSSQSIFVVVASTFAWLLLAAFVLGGAYGLSLDFKAATAEPDPRWGPRLPGELLPGVVFGSPTSRDCSQSTWTGYLNPDFDFIPELQARPLTVVINTTQAADLDWAAIAGHAKALFGVTLQPGPGLPVLLFERTEDVGTHSGGRLNHDQHYIRDREGRLVYRDHSFYRIELFPTGNEELFFLHELGHSLGLGHIDRDGHIMAHRSDRMAFRIHECHADWIQHLAPTVWRHTWP